MTSLSRGAQICFGQTFLLQATLTPNHSHWRGRGRIVGCRLENPAAGLAGRASVKPESSDVCSFSSKIRHSLGGGGREKVRMRASLSQKLICALRRGLAGRRIE
jgi:hypothetical protein